MNNNVYYNDCFTEIEPNKINAKFNKTTMNCFDSENNKFSMDCEGNLVVNSIITRESNTITGVTVDQIYPIGSIYMSTNTTNPSILFGGTWERIKDKFLLSAGDSYQAGTTGGIANHSHTTNNCTLTAEQIPSHQHSTSNGENGSILNWDNNISGEYWGHKYKEGSFASSGAYRLVTLKTGFTGGNQAHNHGNTGVSSNMPPYMTVYMWKRVA